MINPPIIANIGGAPCAVSYGIVLPPGQTSPSSTQVGDAEVWLLQYQAEVLHLVAAARQQNQLNELGQRSAYGEWGPVTALYQSNQGLETLRLTVAVGGHAEAGGVEIGGVFDIKVAFTGFPYPSMGAYNTGWADHFQFNGPVYQCDPAFSPSDPGPRSRFDTSNAVWVCDAPVKEPDMNATLAGPPLLAEGVRSPLPLYTIETGSGTTAAVTLGNPDTTVGIMQPDWCAGVGGSAILTTPLSGKQYWEVEIVTLPHKVPAPYNTDLSGFTVTHTIDNGTPHPTHETVAYHIPIAFLTVLQQGLGFQGSFTTTWPSGLDAFGSPCIGIVPGYYLPADMLPGISTAPPLHFQDYTRSVGLDPVIDPKGDKSKLARSIYLTRTSEIAQAQLVPSSSTAAPSTTINYPGVWEVPVVLGSDQITQAEAYLQAQVDGTAGSYPAGSASAALTTLGVSDLAAYKAAVLAYSADPTHAPVPVMPAVAYIKADPSTGVSTVEAGAITERNGWSFCCADNPVLKAPPGGTLTPDYEVVYGQHMYFPMAGDRGIYLVTGLAPNLIYPTPTTLANITPVDAAFAAAQKNGYVFMGMASGPDLTGAVVTSSSGSGATYYVNQAYQGWNYSMYVAASYVGGTDADGRAYPRYTSGYTATIVSQPSPGSDAYTVYYFASDNYTTTLAAVTDVSAVWSASPKPTQGLHSAGYHAPVYVGRVDSVADDTKIGDGTTIPLDGSLANVGQTMGLIGQFTGVDLGPLVEGDVVMMAADTASGKVWFGKNGDWYAPGSQYVASAVLDATSDGPAFGTKWAAIMDGGKNSATPVTVDATTPTKDQPPEYFPAVGFRQGPLEAKIHYGSGMKYKTPNGFTIYGLTQVV